MRILRNVGWLLGMVTTIACNAVEAQSYPAKPIRIYAAAAGGGTDFAARIVAQHLTSSFSQQVFVENRPVNVAIATAAKTAPDGYSLLVMGLPLWITPLLEDNVAWDPIRDFSPITMLTVQPTVIVVHPSVAASNVRELIALAKSKPGELNVGNAGIGTSPHLAAELFKSMAGINLASVPYAGSGPAIAGLLGNHVQVLFGTPSSIGPHIKAGKVRALAVTSAQTSVLLPDLPTAASTVPGYDLKEVLGFFTPAKTPSQLINMLNQEANKLLRKPEVRDAFLKAEVEPVGGPPEELAAVIKSDIGKFGKLIREASIKAM